MIVVSTAKDNVAVKFSKKEFLFLTSISEMLFLQLTKNNSTDFDDGYFMNWMRDTDKAEIFYKLKELI